MTSLSAEEMFKNWCWQNIWNILLSSSKCRLSKHKRKRWHDTLHVHMIFCFDNFLINFPSVTWYGKPVRCSLTRRSIDDLKVKCASLAKKWKIACYPSSLDIAYLLREAKIFKRPKIWEILFNAFSYTHSVESECEFHL